MKKHHLLAVVGEGGLILVVGAAGWAAHMPLIFASLGPTAYELMEAKESKRESLQHHRRTFRRAGSWIPVVMGPPCVGRTEIDRG